MRAAWLRQGRRNVCRTVTKALRRPARDPISFFAIRGGASLKDLYDVKKVPMGQPELDMTMNAHALYAAQKGGLRAQLMHKQLDGLLLANRNLAEADLSGASLVGASLFGANLTRAILYCADLRDCDLRRANLTRADLRGASFKGASLANAVLDNADLRSGMMMYMGAGEISRAGRDSSSSESGVDFSHCSLKGASFGNAKLDGVNFTGALLQNANFRSANFTNVVFKDAVLTGANVSELHLPPEAFAGAVLDVTPEAMAKLDEIKARIEAHQKWATSHGQDGKPAQLDDEDLRPLQKYFVGRRMPGLQARRARAIGLDFSDAQLQAAKFDGADLRGASFSRADLRGVSFKGAILSHADFTGANLQSLKLANGTVLTPDLSDAELADEQLQNALRD